MVGNINRDPIDVTDEITTRRFFRQFIDQQQKMSEQIQKLERKVSEAENNITDLNKRVLELEKKP